MGNNAKLEQLNSINGYLSFRKIDATLCTKIRSYYNYLWTSGQSRHQKEMFEELPSRLQIELNLQIKEELVLNVPVFRRLQAPTLLAIIHELRPHIVLPDTILVKQGTTGENMYLIFRGKF